MNKIYETMQITVRDFDRNYKSRVFFCLMKDLKSNKVIVFDVDGADVKIECNKILNTIPDFALNDVNWVLLNRNLLLKIASSNPLINFKVKEF